MKMLLYLYLPLFIIFSSCSKSDTVMIRVKNVSSHDYQNVTLINQTISTISSGQKSSYYIFEEAYEYGYIELDVDGATYKLIPIDFVGESPLKNGKYTYEIDADLMRGGDVLSLKFVED